MSNKHFKDVLKFFTKKNTVNNPVCTIEELLQKMKKLKIGYSRYTQQDEMSEKCFIAHLNTSQVITTEGCLYKTDGIVDIDPQHLIIMARHDGVLKTYNLATALAMLLEVVENHHPYRGTMYNELGVVILIENLNSTDWVLRYSEDEDGKSLKVEEFFVNREYSRTSYFIF